MSDGIPKEGRPNRSRRGEPQYQESIRDFSERGTGRLGVMTSWAWENDPKRLAFTLARYKFVAKMLNGYNRVLEAGCGDGFATRIVAQAVGAVTAVDFDPAFIEDARSRGVQDPPIDYRLHDMLTEPVDGTFDAAYSLDVLEHIAEADEDRFLRNMIDPLMEKGVCIVGMPSLESQAYASVQSREGHVNCKPQPEFATTMQRYFHNVFMFSMNDEVVHTGFHAMSHYNIALCCGRKTGPAESTQP